MESFSKEAKILVLSHAVAHSSFDRPAEKCLGAVLRKVWSEDSQEGMFLSNTTISCAKAGFSAK